MRSIETEKYHAIVSKCVHSLFRIDGFILVVFRYEQIRSPKSYDKISQLFNKSIIKSIIYLIN